MRDCIRIRGLRLVTRIGVPEEERAIPQSLSVNLEVHLQQSFQGFDDRIEATIDYYQVSQRLRALAAEGERHLIETLAEDLAAAVLTFPEVATVTLEVEKFILADCESVSVEITRSRATS